MIKVNMNNRKNTYDIIEPTIETKTNMSNNHIVKIQKKKMQAKLQDIDKTTQYMFMCFKLKKIRCNLR